MANYRAVRLQVATCPEPYREQAKQFISGQPNHDPIAIVSIPWNCSYCGIPRGLLHDTVPTTWTPVCHCGESYPELWMQYFNSLEERITKVVPKLKAKKKLPAAPLAVNNFEDYHPIYDDDYYAGPRFGNNGG